MSEVEVSPSKRDPGAVDRAFLIADVRGYTRFTRERGDAAAARLAGAFAGLARDAVAARAGTVIELRGDEALAVFESPAQAVRAAVELVAMCTEDVEANPDLPLLVGIGVDAGPAVPLEGGFRGAAINTAARLCSHAAAGQVLVTATLASRAGQVPGVVFAAHGAVELKGFETPVELIEATASPKPFSPLLEAADHQAEPLPVELEHDTPMVEREHELSWLRGTWRQARRGSGRLVFVSGRAGIGRTRLAAELAAEAVSQAAVVRYVGSGGAAQALAVSELRTAAAADRPTLLILDDVDVLGEQLAPALESLYESIEARPALVVCLVGDADAIPAISALVERADGAGDGHRLLAPLALAGVGRIAELYAGEAASEVSVESLARASEGVPARVHELMSEWAEREASRRLAAAAEWLSAERLERQADLEFANNVIGLKLARLYSADRSAGAVFAGDCPYKGLASFDADDSRFFFGREQLVGELAARTVGVGLLGVIGASGSGKSSAIAAGLVPSLRAGLLPGSERWRITAIRPGDHPATELDAALAGGVDQDERLVLVIDQFEELFAAAVGESERLACVERIVATAADPERFVVVIGLRADFYGHCGSYPELARLLAINQVLVGPMRERELRRAIELPARRVGVRVDSALVDRLASEVVEEPGGLPLLSTALVELWGERTGGWLRLDAHDRAGGVRDAVARLAETTYQRLSDSQRVIARSLFLRLVSTGEEGILVRRTMHRSELGGSDGEVATVVARLTDDRLLTATDDTVEVAHEALVREWPRLAEWLREDAHGRDLREHLILAAKRWDGSGRDAGELYRGARLASTIEWAATRSHELNDLEREFLAESRGDADREAERQRRANRRLRMLLAGLSVVLLCAVAAGVIAFKQRSSARHEATVAVGRQLGAEAVTEPRIDRAMLLARESLSLDRSSQTEGTLLATLLRSPAAIGTFTVPITDRPLSVAVSPDGSTIAVGTNDLAGVMRFYDTRTHRQTFTAPLGPATNLYLPGTHDLFGSPNGPGPIKLIDTSSGHVLRRFQFGHLWDNTLSSAVEPTLLSPDGRFLFLLWAVVNPDGSLGAAYIQRWSVARGGEATVVPMGEHGMVGAAVTSDNHLVVATDGAITTWNAITLKRIRTIRGPRFPSFVSGAISPDGRIFGYGLGNGTVHFANVETGRSVDAQGAHASDVQSIAFSPNSRLAVSTGDDGVAIVWDPRHGRLIERLVGHAGRIPAASFSPDGGTLYTASLDGTVLQWDIAGRRRFGETFTAGSAALAGGNSDRAFSPLPPAAVSPDGGTLATRSDPSTIGLFSTATLARTGSIPIGSSRVISATAWAGRRLVVGADRGAVTIWDTAGRPAPERTLLGLTGTIRAIATSPGGRLVAAVDGVAKKFDPEQGSLAIWHDGRLVGGKPIELHTFGNAVAFSGDGSMLAVAADDGRVLIVDPTSARVLRTIHPSPEPTALAFSPSGTLATGSWAGIVTQWDPNSGHEIAHPILAATAPIGAIAFDPTGQTFATAGGSSGLAKLWTTATLQQLGADLPGGQGLWSNVAFTPDGRYLLAVFGDGTAYRWPATVSAWEQHACAVAGRNFTREEWSRYVGGRSYAKTCPQFPGG